jgi:hypothetical protein
MGLYGRAIVHGESSQATRAAYKSCLMPRSNQQLYRLKKRRAGTVDPWH